MYKYNIFLSENITSYEKHIATYLGQFFKISNCNFISKYIQFFYNPLYPNFNLVNFLED